MGGAVLMPRYEVRRRTVVTTSVVEARNETEARTKARDVWQQDAAIASLFADVHRQPPDPEPGDLRSEARYEETDTDRETEHRRSLRWEALRDEDER